MLKGEYADSFEPERPIICILSGNSSVSQVDAS